MMQVKNIIHAIRQSPWATLLPNIFIIQLLLILGFNTVTFIAIMVGALFWLIGCFLLFILGICLIFHNKWAILPAILFLLIPVAIFKVPEVIQSKIPRNICDIFVFCLSLLLSFTANILLVFITRKYKTGYLRFLANAILFIFLTLVLMFPSYFIGTYPLRKAVKNAKQEAQVIIDKVDFYYQAHQQYPESLTELGYEKDDIPLTGLKLPLHYIKYRDHYYFEFADPLDFLGYWHYDLKKHQWTYE
jgi:hypothetical protein